MYFFSVIYCCYFFSPPLNHKLHLSVLSCAVFVDSRWFDEGGGEQEEDPEMLFPARPPLLLLPSLKSNGSEMMPGESCSHFCLQYVDCGSGRVAVWATALVSTGRAAAAWLLLSFFFLRQKNSSFMKFIVNNSVKIVEAVKNVRCLYRVLVHFLLSLRFVSANISVMHQANRHCSPSCFYYVFDSSILFFIHSSILSVSEMKNKTCIFVHAFHHLCVFVCVSSCCGLSLCLCPGPNTSGWNVWTFRGVFCAARLAR